jgi:hypothetical protein
MVLGLTRNSGIGYASLLHDWFSYPNMISASIFELCRSTMIRFIGFCYLESKLIHPQSLLVYLNSVTKILDENYSISLERLFYLSFL